MEESVFYVPNVEHEADKQRIEQYLKNLQGIFSVHIDTANHTIQIYHSRTMTRRELSRSLNRLGFPEQLIA